MKISKSFLWKCTLCIVQSNGIIILIIYFRFYDQLYVPLIYLLMDAKNQIVKFGNSLVDTAKALSIDPKSFINLDTTNTAIRYKEMAPIVIASQLKILLADCTDEEENNKLRGFIAELETAQQYGIDRGKCELIHWSSVQSKNTVRFFHH